MIRVDRWYTVFAGAVLLAGTVFFAPQAHAQGVAGVEGVVLDPTGALVPDSQVKMTETDKGIAHTATTDTGGHYLLQNLPAGAYTLEVNAAGFKTYIQPKIILQVGQNIQINVTLQVGTMAEHVEVAGSVGMVETRDNTISNVIDGARVLELPLNGRQATDLVLLTGASVVAPGGDQVGSKNYFSSTTISIAGGQSTGTNYMLDGAEHTDTFSNVNMPFPFPDALQEFSVQTSTLPARNGKHPGGVVNVVTKSGANAYHGDLFEFLRNGDVNARNFFAPVHDSLKRNQFGGTFGGKIIKDKLFFFGGFQATRNRQDPPQTTTYIPTAATLLGDFSAFDGAGCLSNKKAKQLTDPANGGAPFAGNQIPVGRFSKAALKLVTYLPEQIVQDSCGKVVYGVLNRSNEAQYIGRIDYVRSAKHSILFRYFDADYLLPPNFSPTNILVTSSPGNAERAQTYTLGDTYTLTPTAVNQFHVAFNRRRDNRGPNADDINPTQLGVNIKPYATNFLQLTTTGYFSVGCGTCGPGHFNVNTYQFSDDFDLVRGKHQIAFGGDFVRTQNNLSSFHNGNGSFTFSGSGVASTGDAMADFQLGLLGASGFTYSKSQEQALRENIPALYIQDTYRVNARLTINAGLRWEPMLFAQDLFGRGSVFSMPNFLSATKSSVFPNAPAGSLYYGDPGVTKAFTNDKWTNFSPRFGLVLNPRGDGKQTLRAGGAVLYDSAQVYYTERVMTNPPFVDDVTVPNPGPFDDPWRGYPGGDPFPIPIPPPKNVVVPTGAAYVVLPPDIKSMYMLQWNVSYQVQFSGDWLATASYLGNKTTHLWLARDINYSVYIPGSSTTANREQRRVLAQINPTEGKYYNTLTITDDGANANYNALLLSVNHRFTHHFTMLTNYTWSHCIGNGDFAGDITGSYYQNPTAPRNADRGDCNYDFRHIFNTSIVAQSPFEAKNWTGRVLGKWQISPSLRVLSGGPLTILAGADNSLSGENKDRVNPVAGVSPYTSSWGSQLQYFNPAAFAANPMGTFGTLGRSVLRGPITIGVNAALVRSFQLTERYRLETRFEAFNAINRTPFNSPQVTFNNATFGRITSAGDPRILQFAMKLHF